MADGNFGQREIYIDLTVVGARVIRAAAVEGRAVKVAGIRINGTANAAGPGNIILRKESASGPVIFTLLAATGSVHDGTFALGSAGDFAFSGLYMDAIANAWQAGSHMIIYTR